MSGTITRVTTGNANAPSISADGRKVAFYSYDALGLGETKLGFFYTAYVADVATGAIVSIAPGANGQSRGVSLSANGGKAAFSTSATNLVADANGSQDDVFVQDLATGTITLVSTGAYGQGNGASWMAVSSADGGKVAFTSTSTNLTASDANGIEADVFVKDLNTGAVTLVSAGLNGQGNKGSFKPSISADGRMVAFTTWATNLSAEPTYDALRVYVKDLQTGALTLVSAGANGAAVGDSYDASISADGTKVAFVSYAANLVPGGYRPYAVRAYVKDLITGGVTLVSDAEASAPVLSADGTKVAFQTYAALSPDDLNGRMDVYLKDLATGTVTLVSTGPYGLEGGPNAQAAISADGSQVAFQGFVPAGRYNEYNLFVASFAPPNRAPTALALSGATVAEHASAGTVVGTFSASDPDAGDTAAFLLVPGAGDGDNAAFAIVGNQLRIVASPEYAAQAGYSIRVRVTDSGGLSYEQAFAVGVTDVNDPPAITGGSAVAGRDDRTLAPFAGASPILVADADAGQTLTATVTYAAANGTLFHPAAASDGSASAPGTYTVSGTAAQVTAALRGLVFVPTANQVPVGQQVATGFTVTVSDGALGAVSTYASAVVTSANDAPNATAYRGSVGEDGGPLLFGPGWADPDLGDAHGFSLDLTGTRGAATIDPVTGLVTYNPNGAFGALPAGGTYTDTFAYTVTDGSGASATATVTVQVQGSNDLPTIAGTATGSVTEDRAGLDRASGQLLISDPDAYEGMFQRPAAAALAGAYGSFAFDAGTGAWSYLLANGSAAVQALAAGQVVTDTLRVVSWDGTASQAVTVTVTGANDGPVVTGAATGQAATDGAATRPFGSVQVTDQDAGARVGLAITLTGGDANGALSGAGLTKTGKGAYQLAAGTPAALTAALQALVFTPTANQVAVGQTVTTAFTLTATDEAGATASAAASVVARSVNEAPTLAKATLSYTVAEGRTVQNLYRDILANVRDADPGDAAGASVVSVTSAGSGTAYLDPARKTLTYTAGGFNARQAGDSFTYTVSDGHGGTVTGTVAVTTTGAALATQVGTAGSDVMLASGSNARLIGYGGSDLLGTEASGTVVFGGDGNDVLVVNGSKAAVHGGTGTNTVLLGGSAQATVYLQQDGRDEVYGLVPGAGSRLDVSQVLAEAQLALTGTGQLGTYFSVSTSGGDASLLFNAGGVASGAGSVLAVLHGVSNGTTLASLLARDVIRM